jgi:hypothetical protein
MQFVYDLFLVLHFIGLAMLFGGFMVQLSSSDKGVNRTMLEGALTQLITGVVMVGIASSGSIDETMNNSVVGIKLLIVLVITVLAFIGRRRQPPQVAMWAIIGLLTLANILIAVFAGVTAS